VALASCQSWLGMQVPKDRVRTAVVSREDGPGMTKKRIQQFAEGRNVPMSELDRYLRFNTYEQKRSFSIDSDQDLEEICKWIKASSIQFCIFEWLNILPSADENSNTHTIKLIKQFDTIRAE